MWINYLCISYVFFVVDIFTRSFDDFVSMKFLIAVLLTLEIFANFPVYSALPFYLKLESSEMTGKFAVKLPRNDFATKLHLSVII